MSSSKFESLEALLFSENIKENKGNNLRSPFKITIGQQK